MLELNFHMAAKHPHLLVLFVPANLAELAQPLDRFFNASFKTASSSHRNKRVLNDVADHMRSEDQKEKDAAASGGSYSKTQFVVPTKLSQVKEPMYTDIAHALMDMQTDEFKGQLAKNTWGELFECCFDEDFQTQAVEAVAADMLTQGGKYFASVDGGAVDPVLAGASADSAVIAAMDAQDSCSHSEQADAVADGRLLVGRKLKDVEQAGKLLVGVVAAFQPRLMTFTLKYYSASSDKKAKVKMVAVSRPDTLAKLLYTAGDDRGDAAPPPAPAVADAAPASAATAAGDGDDSDDDQVGAEADALTLVGAPCVKEFDGHSFNGIVKEYFPCDGLWTVEYSDGAEEDYDAGKLALLLTQAHHVAAAESLAAAETSATADG